MRRFHVTRQLQVVQTFYVQVDTIEEVNRIARDAYVNAGEVEIISIGEPQVIEVPPTLTAVLAARRDA